MKAEFADRNLPPLPKNWFWSTMSDACLKVQDGTHFSPQSQVSHARYRYLTAKNVRPWGLDLSDVSYIGEEEHRAIYTRCDPKKGDVLLVKDGVNTGDAALNTLDGEFSLLSSVCLLRPKPNLLSSSFLRYFLLSPVGARLLTGKMTGTAIRRIILRQIKETPVPIAPLSAQQSIVAEIEKQFSRLDEAVANLKRVKANLKRYKAAVLKAAVEGKLTEDWRKQHPDVEPASELLKRILAERRAKWKEKGKYKEPAAPVTTSLPLLPEGWTWATVDQLTADALIGMDRGRAQQSERPLGVPYIKMNNVTMDGRLVLDGLVYVAASADERNRYAIKCGDLLFNTRNSKELVGKVALVRNIPPTAIYNNNLLRIRVRAEVLPEFVCFQMCADGFRRRMELIKRATTNVAAVYGKDLFPLPIALPPLVEQRQIVAEVEQRLSVIGKLEAAVASNFQRADRLRQSVLREAFSGTLNVEPQESQARDIDFTIRTDW
jgi:type I restriction enzyme, S subunit